MSDRAPRGGDYQADEAGWVIVRQTVSTGQRWYIAKAGQYATRNPAKALIYPTRDRAEEVAEQERRDIARGYSDCRVWIEPAPSLSATGGNR